MNRPFQRARDAEAKEIRRQDLLAAARALVADEGVAAVGLSAIARAAGLAKSNVYRYFASREEILLELLADDVEGWLIDTERALAPLAARRDAHAVADALAHTIAARPLTCELISIVASVLEHNVSLPAALAYKERMLQLSIRVSNALHAALPAIPHDRSATFARYLHALIAGLWPMANPGEQMRGILARREYASLRCDFERDLRGALRPLLAGLVAAG
jgi:AcrR family transcriptional regulator